MIKMLFDLDGTLYHGTNVIEPARDLVNELIEKNYELGFITNNASRTPLENIKHMEKMGYVGLKEEMFFNSSMACVNYLNSNLDGKKVHMVGKEGLREELLKKGYELVEENADYVVVGLDVDATYRDYSQATKNLYQGAKLIGTNSDRILMTEEGVMCGNGSAVNMLAYASDQEPLITGKPSKIYLEQALKYFGYHKYETMIVGDNLETDIQCAINGYVNSCLVLGGAHDQSDIDRLGIKPNRVINNLSELKAIIEL